VSKALLVIDVQVCMFFGDWPVPGAGELLNRIANRILVSREMGESVVFIQNDAPEGELDAPGMPYWQLALAPAEGERVFRKTTQNAFESNQELARHLRELGVDELELTGLQSELCLQATGRGAVEEGFRITVNRALHGTYDSETESAESISDRIQKDLEALSA
jgi:nicotinamidase-related amidase